MSLQATLLTVAQGPADAQGSPPAAPSLSAEERAFAQATASGERVEVVDKRTEYGRTFANPDGTTFTQEQSSAPVFGRDAAGGLVPVDTTLVKDGGQLRPRASAVELVFPSAGSSTLSMSYLGHKVSLALEGKLTEPILEGDTATYAEVFPGVDLKLTATAEGYRQVYVVKTRAAAANPALKKLTQPATGTNGRLVPRTGGGAVFVDPASGATVFSTAQAIMWDSTGGTQPAASKSAKLTDAQARLANGVEDGVEDPADAPSPRDQVAEMPVAVTGGALEVTPDANLLADPDTVFPVYIDPFDGIDRNARLMLRTDNVNAWQFPEDEGMGRCPTSYTTFCTGPYTKRLFYQFGQGALRSYDKVLRAEFRVRNVYSMSCDARTVEVHRTGNVHSGTNWPGPGAISFIDDYTGANGWGGDCAGQADLEFSTGALTSAAASLASGGIDLLTLRLKAKDESDQRAWKRFSQAGVLSVWYARKPHTPSGVAVESGQSLRCAEYDEPQIIASYQPSFHATPQTMFNGADTSDSRLQIKFQAQTLRDGTWDNVLGSDSVPYSYRPSGETEWAKDGVTEKLNLAVLGKTLGKGMHRVRALTRTHYTYPNAAGEYVSGVLESDWTPKWCHFIVDPDRPPAPIISGGAPYVIETDQTGIVRRGGPGIPGVFTFNPGKSTVPTAPITRYTARLTAPGDIKLKAMSGETGGATVTPDTYGAYTIAVKAWDSVSGGRDSLEATERFYVAVPKEAGLWDMDLEVKSGVGRVAVDKNPSGVGLHDLSLHGWPSVWDADGPGRGGKTDLSLSFSGTEEAKTSEKVLNTADSFSISAWVYLKDGDLPARSIVSQFNPDNSAGIDLRYQRAQNTWGMCWSYYAADGRKCATVLAPNNAAIKDAWTHVAGVYDNVQNKLFVYVNGRLAGERALTAAETPKATTGPLTVGKSPWYPFNGLIDQVRVWNQPVSPGFMLDRGTFDDRNPYDGGTPDEGETGQSLLALVGSWDTAIDGMSDQSLYGRAKLDKSATGVTFDPDAGAVLDGQTGRLSTDGPFLDETGSFTVSAKLNVDEAALAAAPQNYQARIMGQSAGTGKSGWALWFTKKSLPGSPASGVWTVGRWESPGGGQPISVGAESLLGEASNSEVTVNAVYDSIEGELSVYEGGDFRGEVTFLKPLQGSGKLYVGWGEDPDAGHFAGSVRKVQLWAGAMNSGQLSAIGQLTQGNEVTP